MRTDYSILRFFSIEFNDKVYYMAGKGWTDVVPILVTEKMHYSLFSDSWLRAIDSCLLFAFSYKCDSSVGVHRYTRWTGRLSYQTRDLSHPHNPVPEGCDLGFAQYQVQVDVGMDLPGYCQTTKVTLSVPQKGLGTCIWINKSHNPFWLCSSPQEALRWPK